MIQFKHPSTFLVSGATQYRKIRFILRMLDDICNDQFFYAPIWCILYSPLIFMGEFSAIRDKSAWRQTRLAVNPHGDKPAWQLITNQLTTLDPDLR